MALFEITPSGDLVEEANLEKILCHCGGILKIVCTEKMDYSDDIVHKLLCQSCHGYCFARQQKEILCHCGGTMKIVCTKKMDYSDDIVHKLLCQSCNGYCFARQQKVKKYA